MPQPNMESTLRKLDQDEAVEFAQANIRQFIDALSSDGYDVDQERFDKAQDDAITELRHTYEQV